MKFSKEQIQLFKENGVLASTPEGEYMFLPFWFKETEAEDMFEAISLGKLPEDLKEFIIEFRDETPIMKQKREEFADWTGSKVDFDEQWKERIFIAYKKLKTPQDIHNYRCGNILI